MIYLYIQLNSPALKDDINILEPPNIYKGDKISQVSPIFKSSKVRETKLDKKNQMTQVRLPRTNLDAWLELIKKLRWLIRWRGLKWATIETDVKNTRSSLHGRISLLWSSTESAEKFPAIFTIYVEFRKFVSFKITAACFARGARIPNLSQVEFVSVGCFMTLIWKDLWP